MSLSETDLEALRLLIGEEISTQLQPVDQNISILRNEMQQGFDGLHKQMETLQREYEFTGEQLKRKDKRLDDHEERLTTLEEKVT